MRWGLELGLRHTIRKRETKDVTCVSGLSEQQGRAIYGGEETKGPADCCGESQVWFWLCL